jgi:hypothetical protein
MDSLKLCNLCGCGSNDTAIMTCTYAKGELNICLECLTEGVLEVVKEIGKAKTIVKGQPNPQNFVKDPLPLDAFDLAVPEDVYGFSCQNCGTVQFSNVFPVNCDCGHLNTDTVMQSQNFSQNNFSQNKINKK